MKKLFIAAVLAASFGGAQAAFVNGGISFVGGITSPGGLTNLPNTLVSALTSFDVDGVAAGVSASGNFSGGIASASDFVFGTPGVMFTLSGFTFTANAFSNLAPVAFGCTSGINALCNDGIGFEVSGTVTGNGFQATGFSLQWSATAGCTASAVTPGICGSNPTASYTASLTSTGSDPVVPPTIPEPTSLALVGLALAGAGFASRRRKA